LTSKTKEEKLPARFADTGFSATPTVKAETLSGEASQVSPPRSETHGFLRLPRRYGKKNQKTLTPRRPPLCGKRMRSNVCFQSKAIAKYVRWLGQFLNKTKSTYLSDYSETDTIGCQHPAA